MANSDLFEGRNSVIHIALWVIATISLVPLFLFVFGGNTESGILKYLPVPYAPIFFLLLFSFALALCIYIGRPIFLALALPSLLMAISPLLVAIGEEKTFLQKHRSGNYLIYAGQTMPGEGFLSYPNGKGKGKFILSKDTGFFIDIKYDPALKKYLENRNQKPIIVSSLNGESSHWTFIGGSQPYGYKGSADWFTGFRIYFRYGDALSKPFSEAGSYENLPYENKWSISYTVIANVD